MKKILVSRCLYGGEPVRYDGKSKAETDERFLRWKEEGRFITVCPEVFGGLPTPRVDAQRKGDRVVTRDGRDVTYEYLKGAGEALRLATEEDVLCALMKEKSPSCGSTRIYDGEFSGNLIDGEGTAAELLRKAGVKIYSELQLDEVDRLIRESEKERGNIILTGMPACGKSVTGVVLAKVLNKEFTDTDLLIQKRAGKSLQAIIDEDGIDTFKEVERKTLLTLDVENTVVATGGSAVYYDDAMGHLSMGGPVIYIRIALEEVLRRLDNITTRGVAMGRGETLADLYRDRVPLYEKYADITVDTGKDSIEETVERMAREISMYQDK